MTYLSPETRAALAAHTLQDLPHWLLSARLGRNLTLGQAATQIGISIPAVARVERGLNCQAYTAVKILRWIAGTPDATTDRAGAPSTDARVRAGTQGGSTTDPTADANLTRERYPT